MQNAQYPIGKLNFQQTYWPEEISGMTAVMAEYPAKYEAISQHLSEADLAAQYREGSFTVRQIFHHLADMQFLNFMRFKIALTEDAPTAPVVNIDAWTTTADNAAPIEDSVILLKHTHNRWVMLLKSLDEEQWNRTYFHPVRKVTLDLRAALHLSSWHIQHHYEHLKIALGR